MALSEITTRAASVDDVPMLARMHVTAWRETYAGVLPDAMLAKLSVESRAIVWDRILREPSSSASTRVRLAEINGELAGFGSCGPQRTEYLSLRGFGGEISAIYVLRSFQGKGVGVRLLRTMASDLVNCAFAAASLWVLKDNPAARRFYERQGGSVIDERVDRRDDAVLIELAYGWPDLTHLVQRGI